MTVARAQVGEHLQPGFGLWLNHGAEPLVQHHPDGRAEPLVEGQTGFDLTGAVGLWNRAEVGFALPLSNLSEQGFGPGDLRLSGKVRVLGCSNETSWGLMKSIEAAKAVGAARYQTIQNNFSLNNRRFEDELAQVCRKEGVSLIPYSPIGGGVLWGTSHM